MIWIQYDIDFRVVALRVSVEATTLFVSWNRLLGGAAFLLATCVIHYEHLVSWCALLCSKFLGVDGGGEGLKTHERF